ncbi:MAG: hypothetical protein ACETWK_14905 [Candidatus Aminicenantaceae bacterium]
MNCLRGAGCQSPNQPEGLERKTTPSALVTSDTETGGAGGE